MLIAIIIHDLKRVCETGKNRANVISRNSPASIDLDHQAFQTTVQIFHTDLLENNIKGHLIELMETYPIALTNDQPIANILFNGLLNCWRWLPIRDKEGCLYDYFPRFEDADKYVMVKDNSRNI